MTRDLKNFGSDLTLPSDDSVQFVDNHDLQRTFAHPNIRQGLSFWDPIKAKIGNAFMLAWPYGTPKIMSSYKWPVKMVSDMEDENQWYGPPHEEENNFTIKRVSKNPDGSCSGDWICEHRWKEIYSMVNFRSVVGDAPVAAWWDNGGDQIAFARAGKGFIAINNEANAIDVTVQTTLPPGVYCDVIRGEKKGNDSQ